MMKNIIVPSIKKEVYWNMEDVRAMCIRHSYYTHGDVDDYSDMLTFVGLNDPTDENIYKVAFDIVAHSNLSSYGQTEEENINSIMYNIQEEVIHTFFHTNEN